MGDLQKKIKQEEARIGRPLHIAERLSIIRNAAPGNSTDDDMDFILTETTEGVEAKKAFDAKIAEANQVNNLHLRHVASLQFEEGKRDLLKRFHNNELHRIDPRGANA